MAGAAGYSTGEYGGGGGESNCPALGHRTPQVCLSVATGGSKAALAPVAAAPRTRLEELQAQLRVLGLQRRHMLLVRLVKVVRLLDVGLHRGSTAELEPHWRVCSIARLRA